MQLAQLVEASPDEFRERVCAVRVVKVFYVSTGRNGWWSTWVAHYSPGCMHATLESAKAFCEQRRVQGTVFYINELPSLAFVAPECAFVSSEINTESFFDRLDAKRLTSIIDVVPIITMALDQIVCMFHASSALWPPNHPRKDSAILSYCSAPEILTEISPAEELRSYASSSDGPKYMLRWVDRPFTKNRNSVHQIAATLARSLGAP